MQSKAAATKKQNDQRRVQSARCKVEILVKELAVYVCVCRGVGMTHACAQAYILRLAVLRLSRMGRF